MFYKHNLFLYLDAVSSCKAPSLVYGTVSPSSSTHHPDSVVTFSCISGYLIGPKNSTCQMDGTWSGTAPFCVQGKTRMDI